MRRIYKKLCTAILMVSLLANVMTPLYVTATQDTPETTNSNTVGNLDTAENSDATADSKEKVEVENPALKIPVTTNEIEGWPEGPIIPDETAILMEADTGAILYNKQMDEVRYPASTTKIMTALLALENSALDETVTFTETGMEAAYGGSSNIIPVLGESFTMEQCLYMLMLKSANDVANQIAEHVGGTLEAFVQMMNDRAKEIGCKNTKFNNPNGLPDEEHYTTAYDLALIMKEALKNSQFRKIINTKKIVIPATNKTNGARTYENHHHMLLDGEYQYEGTIGGKTGYTDAALCTLVTAAERNGSTLIAVVLRVVGRQCFTDTIQLMDYGFNNFKRVDLSQETENQKGIVMLPTDALASEITSKEIEETEEGIQIDYFYHEQKVGEVMKEKERPVIEKDVTESVDGGLEKQQKQKVEKDAADFEVMGLKFSKLQVIIGVLGVLVVVGVILIIISAIRKRINRKRRRRIRQERMDRLR